jgi:hypothetical protein
MRFLRVVPTAPREVKYISYPRLRELAQSSRRDSLNPRTLSMMTIFPDYQLFSH